MNSMNWIRSIKVNWTNEIQWNAMKLKLIELVTRVHRRRWRPQRNCSNRTWRRRSDPRGRGKPDRAAHPASRAAWSSAWGGHPPGSWRCCGWTSPVSPDRRKGATGAAFEPAEPPGSRIRPSLPPLPHSGLLHPPGRIGCRPAGARNWYPSGSSSHPSSIKCNQFIINSIQLISFDKWKLIQCYKFKLMKLKLRSSSIKYNQFSFKSTW